MFILCDQKRLNVLGQRINADTRRTERIIVNPKIDLDEIFSLKTYIVAFNSFDEAKSFINSNIRELSEFSLDPVQIKEEDNEVVPIQINPTCLIETIRNLFRNIKSEHEIIYYIKTISKHFIEFRYIVGDRSYKINFIVDDALPFDTPPKTQMKKYLPKELS